MKNMKKYFAAAMSAAMVAGLAVVPTQAEEAKGSVYYLNFKPEQATQWEDLAAKYTDETGVEVNVLTAASGTYESTLKSEMAKDEVPTLFQVNGPVGLATWKDYCLDLKDSDVYSHLKSDDFALKDGDSVYGLAYVIETYGIIYNKALLADYCALDGAVIKDASEITSFDTLKAVADDIQARKDELGVEGAFTSAGMDSSSDWRFKTHLANLPIYYEYQADGIDDTDAIKGTYLDNYKNVFDLYITDSTCDGSELSAKTADEALTNALIQMETTSDQIEYEVVEEEKSGILGLFSKPAVIRVRKKENVVDTVKNFLAKTFQAMKLDVEIETEFDEVENEIRIELKGTEMGMLIGKRGQTLDSLQYLTSLVANKNKDTYTKIKIDTENYRQRRKETIENLARNVASKVKKTGRPAFLEPMNPYERRIIHAELQADKYVDTHSEGEEPHRKVVITLNREFASELPRRNNYRRRNNNYSRDRKRPYQEKKD